MACFVTGPPSSGRAPRTSGTQEASEVPSGGPALLPARPLMDALLEHGQVALLLRRPVIRPEMQPRQIDVDDAQADEQVQEPGVVVRQRPHRRVAGEDMVSNLLPVSLPPHRRQGDRQNPRRTSGSSNSRSRRTSGTRSPARNGSSAANGRRGSFRSPRRTWEATDSGARARRAPRETPRLRAG